MASVTRTPQKWKYLFIVIAAFALFMAGPFTGNSGQWALPGIATVEASPAIGPVTGRFVIEANSYFCMNAPYPAGVCVPLTGGLGAGGVVLGQQQPMTLTPDVCANNGGGTGYVFDACVGSPNNIAKPFSFFGSPTYISTNPISWQSCIPHFAPSAEVVSVLTPSCSSLKADLGGWEVFWNGSVFQQGPRLLPGVNVFATGQLCDDDTYELDWPAKIVGGPFNNVTGFWQLRGHLNTACGDMICDDNDPCTINKFDPATCLCDFTELKVCDDGNDCTDDTCDPLVCGGCVYTDNTAACTPATCYTGTTCSGGVCGTPVVMNCNDNNACTQDSCNPSTGLCQNVNITMALCNDNNPCTTDACVPATGACTYTNNTLGCNDNNGCTTTDTCSGGVCVGSGAKVCNDNNPCTNDTCDPLTSSGGCVYTANFAPCTPDACHTGTTCADKVCGTPINCSDNDPCTTDTCAAGVCTSTPKANGAACDDNDACTAGETCSGGICGNDPYERNCDDWNACTVDSCDTATGCVNAAADCDDNNPCTDDSCDTATGCVYTNNTSACDDGSLCTNGDVCSAGVCSGTAISCNDNNVCTDDSCDSATGCAYTNNTAACDDGAFCTGTDTCSGGACVSSGDPCVAPDVCDEISDTCITCTVNADCNDNNACTDDVCTAGVCSKANNTAVCNDGNACTSGDVCSGGVCVGGSAPSCDDNNVCTTDSCDTATGCVNTNNTTSCDDGAFCNGTDTCSGGACVSSGDPCTAPDVCNEGTDTCVTPTPPVGVPGDVNNDGEVTVADALLALRIVAGIDTETADALSHCDVAPLVSNVSTPDGKCNIGDVVVILRKAVGLI